MSTCNNYYQTEAVRFPDESHVAPIHGVQSHFTYRLFVCASVTESVRRIKHIFVFNVFLSDV